MFHPTRLTNRRVALGCILTTAALSVAHADVTFEERISVEGAGMMSVANMSGRSVTTIAGDRARMESDMQMQSRLARMVTRDAGQSVEIVRLDQDKVYLLDPRRKQYTEQSLAEMRAQLETAMAQAQQVNQSAPASPVDESDCEWSEAKADVTKSGERATIAGFDAERVTVNASQSCKHKKTGAVCEFALSLDQWLTPSVPGGNDVLAFQRTYAQKMGFDAVASRNLAQRAEAMFGRYEGIWKQLVGKMGELQGYPVRSRFSLAIGGPQCQDATGQTQAAMGQSTPGGADAQTTVAEAVGQAAGETAAHKAGQGVLGGIAGQLGGRIAGSMFKRRQQQQQEAQEQDTQSEQQATAASTAPTQTPGMVPFMTVSSELVSVSTGPAPASVFEIPAGYKKAASSN